MLIMVKYILNPLSGFHPLHPTSLLATTTLFTVNTHILKTQQLMSGTFHQRSVTGLLPLVEKNTTILRLLWKTHLHTIK